MKKYYSSENATSFETYIRRLFKLHVVCLKASCGVKTAQRQGFTPPSDVFLKKYAVPSGGRFVYSERPLQPSQHTTCNSKVLRIGFENISIVWLQENSRYFRRTGESSERRLSSKTRLLLVAPSAGLKCHNIGTTEVSNSSSLTFNFFTSNFKIFLFDNASKYGIQKYHFLSTTSVFPLAHLLEASPHITYISKKCLHFNEEAFNFFS